MVRQQQDPPRPRTGAARITLERVCRAGRARADRVARARARVAVAGGASYTKAAAHAGRRAGDGVAQRVARFNQRGLAALDGQHGGGPAVPSGPAERSRMPRACARRPDRKTDGTATWSLTTLHRALRRAPDGLPHLSTWTILRTRWDAGSTCPADRTWCRTGSAMRKRTDGSVVTVTDPHATPKES